MTRSSKRPRGRPRHADVLTPAEWRTVHAAQHGLSNAQIAKQRGVSVNAVKFHIANALAKLGLRDKRALRLWFRAPAGSAMAGPGRSAEQKPRPDLELRSLGQIARSVGDIAASEAWYRDVLRLRHLYTFGQLAFFDLDGVRLMLSAQASGAGPESVLYLRVDDIVAAHAELTRRGVEFTHAPHLIHRHADGTEEWMAFFADPDGRPLAVMAQVRESH